MLINSSHFDEALEFSRSGSDESVDTVGSSPGHHRHQKSSAGVAAQAQSVAPQQQQQAIPQMSAAQRAAASQLNTQDSPPAKKHSNSGQVRLLTTILPVRVFSPVFLYILIN